jgi:hypothetical protein
VLAAAKDGRPAASSAGRCAILWRPAARCAFLELSQRGMSRAAPRETALCEVEREIAFLDLWGAKWPSMRFVVDNRKVWPLCYDRH